MTSLLVDTGPLVAFLSQRDTHHVWVKQAWDVQAELVTCDAVVAEAAFLLGRRAELVFDFLQESSTVVRGLGGELPAIASLMRRYASTPMSFADACLVRLSELDPRAIVTTCDRDFLVYRRLGRQVIPLLAPFA